MDHVKDKGYNRLDRLTANSVFSESANPPPSGVKINVVFHAVLKTQISSLISV